MSLLADIAKVKVQITKLESSLQNCTDTRIREVVEIRLEALRQNLRQLESPRHMPRRNN
jgi:hypothetical protein